MRWRRLLLHRIRVQSVITVLRHDAMRFGDGFVFVALDSDGLRNHRPQYASLLLLLLLLLLLHNGTANTDATVQLHGRPIGGYQQAALGRSRHQFTERQHLQLAEISVQLDAVQGERCRLAVGRRRVGGAPDDWRRRRR